MLSDELYELIAQRFKALSEPTRLRILHLLRDTELSVSEIAASAGLKHGTASANLNALSKAGLVTFRREGTKVLYRVSNDAIFMICDQIRDSIHEELLQYEKIRRTLV